uniref:Uncharacterized protein n=1 Tax=Oryza punctata TaxID=4537 RepID=A0A0E0KZ78_ORYPU
MEIMMSPVRPYEMPAAASLLPSRRWLSGRRRAKGDDHTHGGGAPAATARWIDGKAVDQAVAYALMAAALVATYLLH